MENRALGQPQGFAGGAAIDQHGFAIDQAHQCFSVGGFNALPSSMQTLQQLDEVYIALRRWLPRHMHDWHLKCRERVGKQFEADVNDSQVSRKQ
jgi:hypothetical protein